MREVKEGRERRGGEGGGYDAQSHRDRHETCCWG